MTFPPEIHGRDSLGGTEAIPILPPHLANISPPLFTPSALPRPVTSLLGHSFLIGGGRNQRTSRLCFAGISGERRNAVPPGSISAFYSVPVEAEVGAAPLIVVAVGPNTLLLPPVWFPKG